MYKVSLLPSEYRQIARTAQIKDRALLIVSIVMIALFLVYFFLSLNTSERDKELFDIRLQSDALDKQMNKYLPLEKMNSEVNDMLEQALEAYSKNPEWKEILSRIGNSVPNSIGLTEIGMKSNDGGGECTIHGTAVDNASLVLWLEQLVALRQIGEVRYNLSTIDENDNQNLVQFDLSISLLPGSGYQLQVKGGQQ